MLWGGLRASHEVSGIDRQTHLADGGTYPLGQRYYAGFKSLQTVAASTKVASTVLRSSIKSSDRRDSTVPREQIRRNCNPCLFSRGWQGRSRAPSLFLGWTSDTPCRWVSDNICTQLLVYSSGCTFSTRSLRHQEDC